MVEKSVEKKMKLCKNTVAHCASLGKMHLFRTYNYRVFPNHSSEQRLSTITGISWTPLPEAPETQDSMKEVCTMKEFMSQRILKAARVVYNTLLIRNPSLIRDRKHHRKTHRQCSSGKELVDWLMKLNGGFQSRSQAIGTWQVLVDEGILIHVKQELNFHDKETQFYRFLDADCGLNHLRTVEKDAEEELQQALSMLLQMGPDALLTMILRKGPSQRSADDLEVIYEELLHVKAAAHLSTSVRKELAAVLMFESHAKAGTVLFSQGDKGASWYIIWKGSVNVVVTGKGLVTTLHEGEDFGQLALVNDAPRAATIILNEDNCHFLRVDKQDFMRILKDVEANTMRLEEHGKAVLVLEKSRNCENSDQTNCPSKYSVMSGTPEKILAHLLETVKLDDSIDPCISDFLLTHRVFMPSSQLCSALQQHYHVEPSEGSEFEKAVYAINTKQKIMKLVGQWVALHGVLLKDDAHATDFLESLRKEVSGDSRLSAILSQQIRDRRKNKVPENMSNQTQWYQPSQQFDWFSVCDEPMGKCQPIRIQDNVLYEVFRPDHTSLSLKLPLNTSVQEVMSALVTPGGDRVLVKLNSVGEGVQLKLEATAVYSSLGLNERLFLCTASEAEHLTPLWEQLGPEKASMDTLEQMSSKDLANHLTTYDWELFNAMHEVELIYYIFGRHNFSDVTTANLERFVRRFNELQYWVVTELCLCEDLVKRGTLLKKFIKIAVVLKEQKNLNSFFAVMFGLSNSAVQRLYKTWERVPSKTKRTYSLYERLMDPSRNQRAYRLAVAKLSPPYIPFMPLLLKDMTFIHEGNKSYKDQLVNFEKMRMIAKTVKIVRECRSQPYVPSSPQKSLADRMLLDTPGIRNSTYSETSVSLRSPSTIRQYVQNLKVIDDQLRLTQLSRTLEP